MDKVKLREEIGNLIPKIKSPEGIYELFHFLNYPESALFDVVSKRRLKDFDFKEEINKEINSVYTILSFGKNIPVFLFECKTLKTPTIRYITKKLSDRYIRFLLIITNDYESIIFVFPEYEKVSTGEHKIKITRLVIKKNEIYWTDCDTLANLYYEEKEASWRNVWRKWRESFSVERVTEKFFEDYKNTFFLLRNEFDKQNLSRKQSHEFTLQLLNRIMFLCFISKKRWLNDDPKFMQWLWDRYREAKRKAQAKDDSFYEKWLNQIFFRAFNNKQYEIKDLPQDVQEILYNSPYLNGGLFTENEYDKLPVKINDSLFKRIFNFFEKYNFTIKEDMPLEFEVAVDPQMLGYVYESLANVAEEIYDRNDLGIFYTPRVEVDFMCKRSLVEYLSKNIPEIPKEYFYKLVFDEEKEGVEKYFDKKNLWRKLEECLENLSVVDPACGSGAFLVGMLNVLFELYKLIYNKHLRRGFSDFTLKEEIIKRSLYGVDVMPWAAGSAELRLWLQLIVETELTKEELRKSPLLPNLNLNIRVGDSLVQEIGGLNLYLRTSNISEKLKRKLYALKGEKERYFYNLSAKFSKREEFLEEEAKIFEEIINDRINSLNNQTRILEAKIYRLKRIKQFNLFGDVPESEQKKLFDERKDLEDSISKIKKEIEHLRNVKKNLKDPEKKPFVWDIDFAEIFGDKEGFDIVIGNPPYVRHVKISPPNRLKVEVTAQDKKEYKDSLIRSVKACFPVLEKIDRKSDYYIYFYFQGLSILNPKGTFCFITSNSWLDAGYGKDLQEFLLRFAPIAAIYDNPKRSFKHSDINTIIALFHAPKFQKEKIFGFEYQKDIHWYAISNIAKFVMFKKPFEEAISSENLIDIENIKTKLRGEPITELVKNLVYTDDYRVFPVIQSDLLEDGWEYPEGHKSEKFKIGKYKGNKWGGKYLRAPDIFYTILEKGENKLIKLGNIATVNEGKPTGANDFFFIPLKRVKEYKIEKEFLRPGLMKTRDVNFFRITSNNITRYFLQINRKPGEIKKLNVYKYLKYGKKEVLPKSNTLKSKPIWWKFKERVAADLLGPCGYGDTIFFVINDAHAIGSNSFAEIRLRDKAYLKSIFCTLNSAVGWLFLEIYSRWSMGGGMAKVDPIEYRQTLVFDKYISNRIIIPKNRKIKTIFEELGIDPSKPIREQEPNPLPDRAELDKIIFDELGLTQEERKEVYYAVCELVKDRLEKAKSLKSG
ncbi:MAG: Eco57I restriction-modification methylase domain-containing protein [Candidatus Helarchaeota archaeon]|nr:Eco57I restriction-modification methylase domain-containing protein [Candidatus Helarchaeota archaeon]